ncbi:amidohydrolase family protein [Cognatishimia sp.]|uniref:amidohydrolase family protein n=1 Tax=Cognatishimia sp. TaxID=2211648 RepID=UPI003517514E
MTEALTLKNALLPKSLLRTPEQVGGVPQGDSLHGDLLIGDGQRVNLLPPSQGAPQHLVMTPLTECHVHLDKCFTFSRLNYTGGDLAAAIQAQALDRATWTPQDIETRATRALDDLYAAGCRRLRTHVDWSYGAEATTPPVAWHVLTEIAEAQRDRIDIQIAPLVTIDDLADLDTAEVIARMAAQKSSVLGAFVLGQPDQAKGIENAFLMAQRHDLALDFHVDETLDATFGGLELIADMALKMRLDQPVLCGHACTLSTKPATDRARILDKLAQAGITLAVLPSTNLYLQGRTTDAPSARGLAPIHALQSAGVSVAIGTDNVEDAFYPLGRFDPRTSLELAFSAAHLDPPLGQYLPLITQNAERAMGHEPAWIDTSAARDLLVYDVPSVANFITSKTAPKPLTDLLKGARA